MVPLHSAQPRLQSTAVVFCLGMSRCCSLGDLSHHVCRTKVALLQDFSKLTPSVDNVDAKVDANVYADPPWACHAILEKLGSKKS